MFHIDIQYMNAHLFTELDDTAHSSMKQQAVDAKQRQEQALLAAFIFILFKTFRMLPAKRKSFEFTY